MIYVKKISIKLLVEEFGPPEDPFGEGIITKNAIDCAIAENRFEPPDGKKYLTLNERLFRCDSDEALPSLKILNNHIERIAWFYVNGWNDPIDLDFGVPEFGCHVDWPVCDGNHRFIAAVHRKDKWINAYCSGQESEIERFVYKNK